MNRSLGKIFFFLACNALLATNISLQAGTGGLIEPAPTVALDLGAGASGQEAVVALSKESPAQRLEELLHQDNPAKVLRVQSIALAVIVSRRGATAEARIKVTDETGAPVSGLALSGQWSDVVSGTAVGTTDKNGVALLKSNGLARSGTVTFTVSSLSKNSYTYDPSKNLVTSASVAAGPTP